MLTKGNGKLGKTIWTFSLPSACPEVCKGMTPTCERECYDKRLEGFRPSMREQRERNLLLSKRADFPVAVIALIHCLGVRVLRVHSGGEFYSKGYARKWLRVMRSCPDVTFYFYTRCWRVPAIRTVLEKMSRLKNVRAWYSLDRDTGLPSRVPRRVRLCYLQVDEEDLPPEGTHLVFRVKRLRKKPSPRINEVRTCPTEDGVVRTKEVNCGTCALCFRPLPGKAGVVSLPLVAG